VPAAAGSCPAAKGERLDVRLPARLWGERVTTEISGRASSYSEERQSRIHGRRLYIAQIMAERKRYRGGIAGSGATGRPVCPRFIFVRMV
jgi:hypothetical protein